MMKGEMLVNVLYYVPSIYERVINARQGSTRTSLYKTKEVK
jgi:hypothetical protein